MAIPEGTFVHTANLGAYADSTHTLEEQVVLRNVFGCPVRVTSAWVAAKATANTITYWTIGLYNANKLVCSKALSSGTWVASNPVAMSTPDVDYADIDADGTLYARLTHTGTGATSQTLVGATVTVEFEFLREDG